MVRMNGLVRALIILKVNGNQPRLCKVLKDENGIYVVKTRSKGQEKIKYVPVDELERRYEKMYGKEHTYIKRLY